MFPGAHGSAEQRHLGCQVDIEPERAEEAHERYDRKAAPAASPTDELGQRQEQEREAVVEVPDELVGADVDARAGDEQVEVALGGSTGRAGQRQPTAAGVRTARPRRSTRRHQSSQTRSGSLATVEPPIFVATLASHCVKRRIPYVK